MAAPPEIVRGVEGLFGLADQIKPDERKLVVSRREGCDWERRSKWWSGSRCEP